MVFCVECDAQAGRVSRMWMFMTDSASFPSDLIVESSVNNVDRAVYLLALGTFPWSGHARYYIPRSLCPQSVFFCCGIKRVSTYICGSVGKFSAYLQPIFFVYCLEVSHVLEMSADFIGG